MEKLKKWERAFEREQGEPPGVVDKAASGTFTSFGRKYRQAVIQLHELALSYVPEPEVIEPAPGPKAP